jgi:PAS domain-containing protein
MRRISPRQASGTSAACWQAGGSLAYTLANDIPDLDAEGGGVGFFILDTDITPVKSAEFALRLAASIVESTVEGIMVTDGAGIILSVNPAFTAIAADGRGEGEKWHRRKDSAIFLTWQSTTIIGSTADDSVRHVSIFNDISELWKKMKTPATWPSTTRWDM